jgi:hypothetical protein
MIWDLSYVNVRISPPGPGLRPGSTLGPSPECRSFRCERQDKHHSCFDRDMTAKCSAKSMTYLIRYPKLSCNRIGAGGFQGRYIHNRRPSPLTRSTYVEKSNLELDGICPAS